MPQSESLPGYDPALRAYHEAFESELEAAISRYSLEPSARVLDSPCGDGFYSKLFARHMRGGALTAADLSDAYLDRAKAAVGSPGRITLKFVKADAYRLPFEDASFDFVWCAQSMISLDDPRAAIREMGRVLKPSGRLAVLETDEYHHLLLPWPVGLELAIQKAVREACAKHYGSASKFAQSRKLREHFLNADLKPTMKRTVVADRVAPFGQKEREFLRHHFAHLREFVKPELKHGEMKEFEHFTDPDGPESFLNSPDAELTCLATIYHATR